MQIYYTLIKYMSVFKASSGAPSSYHPPAALTLLFFGTGIHMELVERLRMLEQLKNQYIEQAMETLAGKQEAMRNQLRAARDQNRFDEIQRLENQLLVGYPYQDSEYKKLRMIEEAFPRLQDAIARGEISISPQNMEDVFYYISILNLLWNVESSSIASSSSSSSDSGGDTDM